MDYYKQNRYLARVDKQDNIIGKIERWEAHKKGILHRGFTIMIVVDDKIVLQHRKHPVFDGWFDLGCSSHPVFIDNKIQKTEDAVVQTLKREWNVSVENLSPIVHKGYVVYNSSDKYSDYKEHELCHLYQVRLDQQLKPNYDYMYGYSQVSLEQIFNKKTPTKCMLAPWVSALFPLMR